MTDITFKVNKIDNDILRDIRTDDSYTKVINILRGTDISSREELNTVNYLINFLEKDRDYKLNINNQLKSKLNNYELNNTLLNLSKAIENPAYNLDLKNYSLSENREMINLIKKTRGKLGVNTENIYHELKDLIENIRDLVSVEEITNLRVFKTELIIMLDLFEDIRVIEPSDNYIDLLNKLSVAHGDTMVIEFNIMVNHLIEKGIVEL